MFRNFGRLPKRHKYHNSNEEGMELPISIEDEIYELESNVPLHKMIFELDGESNQKQQKQKKQVQTCRNDSIFNSNSENVYELDGNEDNMKYSLTSEEMSQPSRRERTVELMGDLPEHFQREKGLGNENEGLNNDLLSDYEYMKFNTENNLSDYCQKKEGSMLNDKYNKKKEHDKYFNSYEPYSSVKDEELNLNSNLYFINNGNPSCNNLTIETTKSKEVPEIFPKVHNSQNRYIPFQTYRPHSTYTPNQTYPYHPLNQNFINSNDNQYIPPNHKFLRYKDEYKIPLNDDNDKSTAKSTEYWISPNSEIQSNIINDIKIPSSYNLNNSYIYPISPGISNSSNSNQLEEFRKIAITNSNNLSNFESDYIISHEYSSIQRLRRQSISLDLNISIQVDNSKRFDECVDILSKSLSEINGIMNER
ncbi:uncharacterized protein I206_107275 [Kwoniella pini CBS 10737]|uniref:Uncharacterized protein n=1 Tax=Kwoniella pini CBS 10737 TaxID=1296096 RepID=A0A1B9HYP4_9TREE|nr:uncharacterized protein I206_05180 [Kwoniella pini CBS 10737]OCF48403.1 hypothetical protein I206_05180 [Kwoniella pini CBS 10737]